MSNGSSLSRVRAIGIGIAVAMFISGVLAGAAIERMRHGPRRDSAVPPSVTVVPPDQLIENMKMAGTGVPVVYEALGLTSEQREQIRRIIDASRPRTDSLLRDTWPPLRALIDSVRRQVEQVLTPDQRARLALLRRGGRVQ